MKRIAFLFLITVLIHSFTLSAQVECPDTTEAEDVTDVIQDAIDACIAIRDAAVVGDSAVLMQSAQELRANNVVNFNSLRCKDDTIGSLNGHLVFDEAFVDSLANGRDIYRYADDMNRSAAHRGQTANGTILTKTCFVKAGKSTKYTFASKGHQELAVVVTLAQEIRQANAEIPIIFLTAKTLKDDILEGFKLGADDYITKPFSMEELVFRIEAILRRVRGKKNKESTLYHIGNFTFDTQKQLLSIGDKQTKLTTKENELLALLCSHANEILQRDFALKTIWIDDNYFNARSMDVYITKLRKHLKEDSQIEIINIHGKGYKLITPEDE